MVEIHGVPTKAISLLCSSFSLNMSSSPLNIIRASPSFPPTAGSPSSSQQTRNASIARLSSPVSSNRFETAPQRAGAPQQPSVSQSPLAGLEAPWLPALAGTICSFQCVSNEFRLRTTNPAEHSTKSRKCSSRTRESRKNTTQQLWLFRKPRSCQHFRTCW